MKSIERVGKSNNDDDTTASERLKSNKFSNKFCLASFCYVKLLFLCVMNVINS